MRKTTAPGKSFSSKAEDYITKAIKYYFVDFAQKRGVGRGGCRDNIFKVIFDDIKKSFLHDQG